MGVLRKWDVDKVAVSRVVYFGVSFKIIVSTVMLCS